MVCGSMLRQSVSIFKSHRPEQDVKRLISYAQNWKGAGRAIKSKGKEEADHEVYLYRTSSDGTLSPEIPHL